MSDTQTPPSPEPGRGPDFTRYLPQRSFGLKLLLVCGLALLMAIPAGFVWTLIYARSNDAQMAMAEVAQLRGGEQVLMGPAIAVPYDRDVLIDNKVQTRSGLVVLYPETGTANIDLASEMLKRGLHDVPVYSADATFDASFSAERISLVAPTNAHLRWSEARVYMTVTDLRGAKSATLTLDGRAVDMAPVDSAGPLANGYGDTLTYSRLVGGNIPWLEETAGRIIPVAAHLEVTGAQRIAFAAFANDTTINITSNWTSPSFDGGALPDTRELNENGFTAMWRIPNLARGAAGAGADISFDTLINGSPGVRLLDETSPYKSIQRALKYAPMFLGLVFLTYFLFETTSGKRAHPAQYVLVGLAQLVFYLLLLSSSEVLGFNPGFLVAAIATVSAISLYAGSVFGSRSAMLKAFGVFSTLYALIYLLLRMEDYALLAGSVASFLAIAGTMWMTRNLDWYGVGRPVQETE